MSDTSGTTELNFKDTVMEWMRINEEITMLQKEIRQRRNRSTHLGAFIMDAMKEMGKELCNVGEKSLQLKQRKTTASLKKNEVEQLLRKLMSEERALKETNDLFENRVTKIKDYIHLNK